MASGTGDSLLPLARWRTRVLSQISALDPIDLALLDAHGCVLVDDVTSSYPQPPFTSSAMDGFAVRASEAFLGAVLSVVGEARAGWPAKETVEPGQAVRISTGAVVPEGADAVVPREQAEDRGEEVVVLQGVSPGAHVRAAGEDLDAGATVLPAGTNLRAAELGLLASVGHGRVRVRPRPRVVVVSTGDELVDPSTPLAPGKTPDINGVSLTAMAREAGAQGVRHRPITDNPAALREAFEGALGQADLLVTSGGVSAGEHDHVRDVLNELGDVDVVKVAMRPGMPQAFGLVEAETDRSVPVFGLPGNPVSAAVSFEVFVRPAIRRLQGRRQLNRPRVVAVLDESLGGRDDRITFARVTLRRDGGGWVARAAGHEGSHVFRTFALADGLAEIPAGVTRMEAGEKVLVHLLADPD